MRSVSQKVRLLGGLQPRDGVLVNVRDPLDPQLQVHELRDAGHGVRDILWPKGKIQHARSHV